jgi:UDP-glucose 4-epimerase
MENLENVLGKIRFIKDDVANEEAVRAAVKNKDVVYHFAANADVARSAREPTLDFRSNVVGTYNVLLSCAQSETRRVIYASSAAVYGRPERVPIDERHRLAPISPYGAGKLAGEALGFAYRECFGMPFTAVRIFNTYGPRQRRYVIYDLFQKLARDRSQLEVLGTGRQVRDYCYVTDAAMAFVMIAYKDKTDGKSYNLSGGNPITIQELVGQIIQVLGCEEALVSYTGRSWPGDISVLQADISALRGVGFAPEVDLKEGLRRFAEWFAGCGKG